MRESLEEIGGRPTDGAVIQVPGVNEEVEDLPADKLNEWMQSESKPQRTQGFTLVNITAARDDVLTEEERDFDLVATLHPGSNRWNTRAGFPKN